MIESDADSGVVMEKHLNYLSDLELSCSSRKVPRGWPRWPHPVTFNTISLIQDNQRDKTEYDATNAGCALRGSDFIFRVAHLLRTSTTGTRNNYWAVMGPELAELVPRVRKEMLNLQRAIRDGSA